MTLQHREPIKRVWKEGPTGPQRLVTLMLKDGNGADAEAEKRPRCDGLTDIMFHKAHAKLGPPKQMQTPHSRSCLYFIKTYPHCGK